MAKKPAKKLKSNVSKNPFLGVEKWSRSNKLVALMVALLFAVVGSYFVFRSFAASAPSGIVDIDMAISSNESFGSNGYVASVNSSGTPFVTRYGCNSTSTACLNTAWTTLPKGTLKNINATYASGNTAIIVGGTGIDNKYYYTYIKCPDPSGDPSCTKASSSASAWSGFIPAGGNTSSLQTALLPSGVSGCASLFAVGVDRKLYSREICTGGEGADWIPTPQSSANIKKLFKSNTTYNGRGSSDSIYTISDTNEARRFTYYDGSSTLLPSGAYRADSTSPIASVRTSLGNDTYYSAVGSDSRLYYTTYAAKGLVWNLRPQTAFFTDVFATPSGGVYARGADGAIYVGAGDGSIASGFQSLGGNCSKTRNGGESIVCIGSDKKVYMRKGLTAPGKVGWHGL